jgi:small-conductance mechanosensitive channel
MVQDILDRNLWGNSVEDYAVSALFFLVAVAVILVANAIILNKLRAHAAKTKTTVDDYIIRIVDRAVLPVLLFGAFYIAVQRLSLGPSAGKAIHVIGVALLTFLGIRLAVAFLYRGTETYWERKGVGPEERQKFKRLMPIIKVIIWGVGIVFLLDNLGFQISAVVAGLGIGGIAVALAAQAVLGDLFSYFSILFDKPFELGDFVIVDEYLGTVEHVGIKTTRIRSLGGEQLVFSNSDLTGSRIKNYKRMERRRVVFRFGVVYETPVEQMKAIPHLVRDIISSVDDAVVDRVHFASFGDFSLDFEVVYYVLSGDYNLYMDIQERINLAIMEEFEGRGIEFAYPTQTVFLGGEGAEGTKHDT